MMKNCLASCERKATRKGLCGAHYAQQRAGKPFTPIELRRPAVKEWTKEFLRNDVLIDNETGCWLWTRSVNKRGYGRVRVGPKTIDSHVLAFKLFLGDPNGLFVCHNCDNPPCCNPDHLFLGTHADNQNDKVSKGRQTKGVDINTAKLYPDLIEKIKFRRQQGEKLVDMAEEIGVHWKTISRAVNGISWK